MGGAERTVASLAQGLDKKRFNPIICCLNEKGSLAEGLEKVGIDVIALNKRGKFDFSVVNRLADIMKVHSVQIVHTHLWGANLWGRIAAKKAKVPVVIAHEHGIELYRGFVHALCDKFLYQNTSALLFVSEASQKLFLSKVKVNPAKCRVIYNGVDTTRFRLLPRTKAKDLTLVSVGRMVKEKGFEYLLKAMVAVGTSRPRATLTLVGDGPQYTRLTQIKDALNLNGRVVFLGTQDTISEILSQADIFVLPSIKEAVPLSILEAMASGLPVIATDVGGVKEVVIHNQTGIIVQPKQPQELAHAILTLMNNETKRKSMAAQGRLRIERYFSQEKFLDTVEKLYEELLHQTHPTAGER